VSELQGRHSVITASVIVVIGLSSLNVAVVLRLRFGCLLECAHLKWCCSPVLSCEQGVPKPLYLDASMASGRWDAFKDKILHVIGDVEVLGGAPRESAMAGQRGIEGDMRVAPLAAFAASKDPRVVPLRNNPSTLVIQNDGDEMMTGPAALHITRCEARAPPPYYAPCTSYKLNTEWVQVSWVSWQRL
jgi:hypothetical protein